MTARPRLADAAVGGNGSRRLSPIAARAGGGRAAPRLPLAGPSSDGPGRLDDLAGAAVRALARRAAPGLRIVPGPVDGRPPPFAATIRPATDRRPATVVVRDARAYRAVLQRGSVGLGESYLAGWWDSDDLAGALRWMVAGTAGWRRALDRVGRVLDPVLAAARTAPWALRRSGEAVDVDRSEVRAHYDLPHDLFAAMLDETMAYSCAVFEHPGMSLADAQRAKFDRLCQKLGLGPDDHVVEVGTGWGGFAIHAAATYGCRVTTTTVSAAQRDVAEQRVRQAGLADRVTVLGDDYRQLQGTFDALVSVEMVEAVDWRDLDTYLRCCRRLVGDDGRVALQAIVLDDASEPRARHHRDFIRAMVFPGSCIPSVSRLVARAARAGLRTLDVEDIGPHYAETLRRWRANLAAALHRPDRSQAGPERPDGDRAGPDRPGAGPAVMGPADRDGTHREGTHGDPAGHVDVELLRLWELYLAYCEAAFRERHISDVQLVLAPGAWHGDPDLRRPPTP